MLVSHTLSNTHIKLSVGMSMIYTLVEYAKENLKELTEYQVERELVEKIATEVQEKKVKEKKEQLTKKQKQKLQSKLVDGELPRGWDWVCLVRIRCISTRMFGIEIYV